MYVQYFQKIRGKTTGGIPAGGRRLPWADAEFRPNNCETFERAAGRVDAIENSAVDRRRRGLSIRVAVSLCLACVPVSPPPPSYRCGMAWDGRRRMGAAAPVGRRRLDSQNMDIHRSAAALRKERLAVRLVLCPPPPRRWEWRGGGESIRRRWSSRRTDGRSIRLIARDRGWQVRRTKVPGEAKTERAEIPHSRTTSIRRDPSSNSRSGTQLAGGLGHRALLLLAGLCTSYTVLPNDPSATL